MCLFVRLFFDYLLNKYWGNTGREPTANWLGGKSLIRTIRQRWKVDFAQCYHLGKKLSFLWGSGNVYAANRLNLLKQQGKRKRKWQRKMRK